jgi:hypothetical protein
MPYENTRQLKEDILFRASEPIGGTSGWETRCIDYLNRNYRELATGASAFLPEFIDDWWWMQESSYFMLEPAYDTGTCSVMRNSPVITLTNPPNIDPLGWRVRFKDQQVPDIFEIVVGGAAQANLTMDAPYTGPSGSVGFFLMKTNYRPLTTVKPQVLVGAMRAFRNPERIFGLSQERMDELFPLARLMPGIPQAFAIVQELNDAHNPGLFFEVRFSHGGLIGTNQRMRVDFWYRPVLDDLTDGTGSIPRVPQQWRHVLSDMALVQVLLDKNDDRANAAALAARTTLAAMLKENRRRNVKIDFNAGHISPRGNVGPSVKLYPIRTESGLIIG